MKNREIKGYIMSNYSMNEEEKEEFRQTEED